MKRKFIDKGTIQTTLDGVALRFPKVRTSDGHMLEWRNVCTRVGTPVYDAHPSGDLHVHDIEYFGTRGFCQDWDLRYFFYYGLMPDGSGTKASVAGPAKKPEVAILHAVTILGSAHISKGFHMSSISSAPLLTAVTLCIYSSMRVIRIRGV